MKTKTLGIILLLALTACVQSATVSPITNGILRTNLNANGFLITNLPSLTLTSDSAYGAGWNGSLAVPTRNAIYDKIETLGGGVATDTIWDAKGDLAVGTGSNTAIRLAAGSNGKVLITDSTTPTGLLWTNQLAGTTINGLTLAVGYSTGTRDAPTIPSVPSAIYALSILKSGAAIPSGTLTAEFRFSNPSVTSATFIGNGVVKYVGGFDEEIIDPPCPPYCDEISSASTIDINSFELALRVTGTTTINAVTLDENEERIVRFEDALTLTHSANLVMLDGQSRLTETGDYGVFKGYPAGVVKCVYYKKAAGGEILHSGAVIRNASITDPTGIVKANVGLSNVDNTADTAKPVSTATQTQLTLNQRMIDAKTGTKIEVTSESTIASASTVNLNSVAGPQTDVTGTTTINLFNLNEGEVRIVRFASVLSLTQSASLLLPGDAPTITTAPGDYAVLIGGAAGVVTVKHFQSGESRVADFKGGNIDNATITNSTFEGDVALRAENDITEHLVLTYDDIAPVTSQTLKLRMNYGDRILFMGGNIAIEGNFFTTGGFDTTLNTTADSIATLPPGTTTLASLAGAESLTNKKLGSLTSNGFVKTTGGDGTLSVDTIAYAPLASPTFTGTPTLPTGSIATTQSAGNSTTAIATTSFVTTADNLKANLISPTFTTPELGIATARTMRFTTTAAADIPLIVRGVGADNLGTDNTHGFSLLLGHNSTGNIQTWLGASADAGNSAKTSFRFITGIDLPAIGGISNDGLTNRNIQINTNVGIGSGFSAQGDVLEALHVSGNARVSGVYKVGTNQVVGARNTGWTAMTGTPDESTTYAVSTVTLPQLAARVAALQAALTAHGSIGP